MVVNLHRAKVEEVEMEPPPHKKRCVRPRRPSHRDDIEYMESSSSKHGPTPSSPPSSRESYQYLNSNHSASELMRASHFSPSAAASSGSMHRSSRRKSHRKGHDILTDTRHHHHHHHHHHRGLGGHDHDPSSSSAAYPLGQPDRSMLTYTRDIPGAPMETSMAIAAPPPMEGPSHTPIPHTTPIISKDAPVVTTILPAPSHDDLEEVKTLASNDHLNVEVCPGEEAMEVSTDAPKSPCSMPTSTSGQASAANSSESDGVDGTTSPVGGSSPSGSGALTPAAKTASTEQSSSHGIFNSISRSVQTDPESGPSTGHTPSGTRKDARDRSRKDNKGVNRRDIKLPESGTSMKRKAVMEAISEILKKMYANTEKGRLPGSFKGRFSSEFTCDSDMREILHSKTTMTSYGSGVDDPDKSGTGESGGADLEDGHISKARLKEQQQLKDKVANLKWRMQHKRALKMAKRKGERSPCGWMEALNCNMPSEEPKAVERSGYCGLKRGFLLAD